MTIKVLVCEDSPTARALLVGMLSTASGLEVIGEAADGIEAVEMTRKLRPDVVTMDIQMPGIDGFEATKRIMQENPTPIVIVSSLDVTSVSISMEALEAGALAVLPKPVGPSTPGYDQACRYVAATVRSMSQVKLVRRWGDKPYKTPNPANQPAALASTAAKIVAIAASTGGPTALRKVFADLPKDFAVPIVFVQHIALGFAEGFARWLDEVSPIEVRMAKAGEALQPGVAYLAPDNQHLGVSDRATIVLSTAPPIGNFRPSGSFLFDSVGKAFGPASVGVILTGMGSDGVEGLRALKAAGGRVYAQDEATSDIFGMPAAAITAGLPDAVLPLQSIAPQLMRVVAKR